MKTGRLMISRVGFDGGTAIALVSETPTRPAPSRFLQLLQVRFEVERWWRVDN